MTEAFCSPDGIEAQSLALAQAVVARLQQRAWHITTAESCTAGMLGALLTAVSGASAVFDGGVISYANGVKERLLGVRSDTLAQFGAVSAQVAEQMANGALHLMGADLALSITGLAGPTGATPEKPVGLVYLGLATKNGVFSRRCFFLGDRQSVRAQSAAAALAWAQELLTQ